MDAYLAASHEIFRLENEELGQVANGGGMHMFDLALLSARRERDAAKTACMEHIAEHGC